MRPRGALGLCRAHIPPYERNPFVQLCSHYANNDSSGCLYITVYLTVMLQASWHTAEGK